MKVGSHPLTSIVATIPGKVHRASYKWCEARLISKFVAFSTIAAAESVNKYRVEGNAYKFAIESKKGSSSHSHGQRDLDYTNHVRIKSNEGLEAKVSPAVKMLQPEQPQVLFNVQERNYGRSLWVGGASLGELDSRLQVLNDFPGHRNPTSWNKPISSHTGNKLNSEVLNLYSLILDRSVSLDECGLANFLRACCGIKVGFHFVQKIHAKMIHCGLSSRVPFCNPLINLYLKNECVGVAFQIFSNMHKRNSGTWVAMISGLSNNFRESEAILLYREMRRLGEFPTPYVFSSIISASTKIGFFEVGEQLHAVIYKWGYSEELFVCNSLLTLYSRHRNLESAELLFSEMLHKDRVSYNTLISGFSMQGSSEKSLEVFGKMSKELFKPDSVTVACLLSSCASLGALQKGMQLHSYVIKAGMCSDIIIEGSLLDLYVKSMDVKTAHKFFLTARKDNVVLWNVMLTAYGQIGDLHESIRIYSQMQLNRLQPNQYTYPSILRTCTSTGALELGEQLHAQVIKTGFQPNMLVCSVLIDMYAKLGELKVALKIFRDLEEDDIVASTTMIAGYAKHDMFMEALNLFVEMYARGLRLDNIGLASVISACAGIQALNQGRQIHAQSIVSGYSSDLSIRNALVCLYSRCGCIQEAHLAFENICTRDNVSWNGMISGFAQSGRTEEALKVFSQMIQAGIETSMFTYGSAISAAANLTNYGLGLQVHDKIIKKGYDAETEVCNALITLYAKCGRLTDAKKMFVVMPWKNKVSWNAMITGYSQHGCGEKAIELFENMKELKVMPNHITYIGVLSACSHVGLVEEGLSYFNSMSEQHGLVPKPEHYACVVDILGRSGQVLRAIDFVESMPIKPDAMVWRTLLSACTIQRNTEIGKVAAEHLLELVPEDSATYVLMSNMYAVAGRWDYRDRARQLMKDKGVVKEPGRSWIEVKNSLHAFFAGDRLHPLADEIYKYLEELNERVSAIGYIQDFNSLWSDLELEQKDPTAGIHSEKLAVSFGLLSLPHMVPLHVMKNLRICKDCHSWIKFVSAVVGRTIIVRDAYRFHHFQDGACSCKDYW